MRGDVLILPKLVRLLECLCQEICDSGLPDVCTCQIMPGAQVALDYGGECEGKDGMAWVRLMTASAYTTQGAQMVTPSPCDTPLQFTVEVGITRNLQAPEDGFPDADQMSAAAVMQLADMAAMRRAIMCCYGEAVLGAYTPIGPGGLAYGGTWAVGLTSLDDD